MMSEVEDEPLNEKWVSNGECISDNDDDDATVAAVATIADYFLLKYNQRMEYIIWEFARREPIINLLLYFLCKFANAISRERCKFI